VRDVQHRLVALGFPIGGDEPGTYGAGTTAATRAFQERRGLHVDGVCGDHTWAALVEAGYRLGDRLLYLTTPMQRGDDVAELQRRLGRLGFDAGRIDGIFGERTNRALLDFQRNGGLVTDATCGPATLVALARLGPFSSAESPHSVAAVWERERHRRRPQTLEGRTVAVGDTGGLDAVARALAAALSAGGGRAVLLQHPDPSAQAAEANALEVDAYLGLSLREVAAAGPSGGGAGGGCSTAYYRSPDGWESPEGRRLAELVQVAVVPVLGATDGGIRGMAVPVLRETRMPAVVTELGAATVVVERTAELAVALTTALRSWVAPTVDV
jgi:N-acetylmuramoyl-L-alanine amidase